MLQYFRRNRVCFLLCFGWIDEEHPARHGVHIDIFRTNVHVNYARIQVRLVALDAELVQG